MDSEVQADTGTAEDTAAAVDAGQGQGGMTEGLYDEILTSAPEELRPQLQEYLKKADGNVTRKFQEYAERLKPWEAFEGIDGLADVPAEDLQGLLDLRDIFSDPESLESWWEQVGTEMGFLDGDGADGDIPDGDGLGGEDEIPSWAQPLVDFVQQSQEQESQSRAQAEQAERQQAAKGDLDARLKEVTEQHNLEGNEDATAAILSFAMDALNANGDEDDPIGKGLERYLRLTGAAQSELVEDRLGQPDGATSGGRPASGETSPKTFKEANAAGKLRMGVGA